MALKKYYAIVVMNAHTLSNVPESVCIYDTRFTFAISLENDNNVIDFEPCPPLLQVETVDVEQSVHAININPLMLFIRPVRVVLDENEKMYRSIVDPLSDDQERFLMWLIGCSLIDGLQQARLLIFYGKSGMEGKTTLMKNIENMLTGTVSTFTRNPFVAKEQILTVQEMHEMSASRICLFDEGDYDKGFNISNVKKLVSGFLYHVSDLSFIMNKLLITSCNKLGFSEREMNDNTLVRRHDVICFEKSMQGRGKQVLGNVTDLKRMNYAGIAMCVASRYENAPMNIYMALFSIFKKSTDGYTAGVIRKLNSTIAECMAAGHVIAMRSGIEYTKLMGLICAKSPDLTGRFKISDDLTIYYMLDLSVHIPYYHAGYLKLWANFSVPEHHRLPFVLANSQVKWFGPTRYKEKAKSFAYKQK